MEDALTIEANVARSAAEAELAHVLGLSVTTPEEKRIALETLKALSAKHRELETRRKEITAPMDLAKKRVMSLFKPALEKLDVAISTHSIGGLSENDFVLAARIDRLASP